MAVQGEKSMIPMVSIVGKSNSGKTTFLEKLIPELKRRGYRIATVKHHVHRSDIDVEGKDSWRHARAGADSVVIASPGQVIMIKNVDGEYSLDKIGSKVISDADIILTEGYKMGDKPKVEVFRRGVHQEPLCTKEDNLIAFATDAELDTDIPCFDINDARELADFLEIKFLKAE